MDADTDRRILGGRSRAVVFGGFMRCTLSDLSGAWLNLERLRRYAPVQVSTAR